MITLKANKGSSGLKTNKLVLSRKYLSLKWLGKTLDIQKKYLTQKKLVPDLFSVTN